MVNLNRVKKKIYLTSKKISHFKVENYLNYLNKDSILLKYWDFEVNWGDKVNPYLINKITGLNVVSSNSVFNFLNKTEILGIGSIISGNIDNYVIWGSGIISENTIFHGKPKDVLAIRGKNTQKKLKQIGLNCEVMGDPVLLFPEIFPGLHIQKKYKYGIIPHFKNKQSLLVKNILELQNPEIKIIDIQSDGIEKFVEDILSCENILSSSLHGLIVAEAYGIPTRHLVISEKLLGGDFKFIDYYSGVGIDYLDTVMIHDDLSNLKNVLEGCSQKNLKFDASALKNSLTQYINRS
jgi:pyruvyltransferase